MTSNNFERLKIVLGMVAPFDYDEFLRICETDKIQPLSMNEYAMKVGYVEMAKIKYPDMPIEEAYLKIVAGANNQPTVSGVSGSNGTSGCSGCGGGKVV